jgi:hypothetical protein
MRILALLLAATPALAERPLTGAEFESLVEGRTLTYGHAGTAPYGVEHYHPGRRVTWAWLDGAECSAGKWYEEGPADDRAICFLYEHDPEEPKCWQLFREGDGGLSAVFLNDGGTTVLYEIVEDPGSLVCGGAGV